LFSDGSELKVVDLPSEVRETVDPERPRRRYQSGLRRPSPRPTAEEQVKAAMSRLERELIVKALESNLEHVTHARDCSRSRGKACSSR